MSKQPVVEAAVKLRKIEGDILVAVLFLPVALAFQQLVGRIVGIGSPIDWQVIEKAIFVTIVLAAWIAETIVVAMTVYRSKHWWQLLAGSFFTLLFVMSVTLTSFAYGQSGFLFQVVFVVSVIAAFLGSLFFYDWNMLITRHQGLAVAIVVAFAVPVGVLLAYPSPVPATEFVWRDASCSNDALGAQVSSVTAEVGSDLHDSEATYVVLHGIATTHGFSEYVLYWSRADENGDTAESVEDGEVFEFRRSRDSLSVLQNRDIRELKPPSVFRVTLRVYGHGDTDYQECQFALRVR